MDKIINVILISDAANEPLFQEVISWGGVVDDQFQNIESGTLYLNTSSDVETIITKHSITKFPALVFMDEETSLTLASLEGNQVTQSNFDKMALAIDSLDTAIGDGFFTNDDGEIIGSEKVMKIEGDGIISFFGLGLDLGLNFNFSFKQILLWGLAGFGGYKLITAKSNAGRALWGAGTAYVGYELYKGL